MTETLSAHINKRKKKENKIQNTLDLILEQLRA
jgi:hypothetical protein